MSEPKRHYDWGKRRRDEADNARWLLRAMAMLWQVAMASQVGWLLAGFVLALLVVGFFMASTWIHW